MPSVKSTSELDFVPRGGVFPSPADWRDQFIYFLMVDRFDDNRELTPAYDPSCATRGRDPGQAGLFQGGNLKGVKRRLDYIKGLGCTAIWLSPIFKNRQEKNDSYHGYGVQNFLEVDPRFGTLWDLRELVQSAHAKGLYAILDIIINHTGDNWSYKDDARPPYRGWGNPYEFGNWREADPTPDLQDGDSVWPLELQHPERYKRRGRIANWQDSVEAIDGDFGDLKELELRNPAVLDASVKIYKYWIAAADVDGFRLDTVKHMEDSVTAIFCNAIREYARRIGKDNFFLFGEVVGDDRTLEKYIGRNSRIEGTNERFPSLDACLDFPLFFILENTIKGFANPGWLMDRYERFKTLYADHGAAGAHFVTFVDNHDQNRRFLHGNAYRDQMVEAIGYLLCSQGVPCIYYGSEQGFDGGGGNDGYVRECMFGGKWGAFDTVGSHFFDDQNMMYRRIRAIADIRSEEPALRYGRQYFRETSADGSSFAYPYDGRCTLAFSRILDSDEVIVAINLSLDGRHDYVTVDRNLTPPGSRIVDLLNPGFRATVSQALSGRALVQVPLRSHQVAILKRQE